MFSHSCTDSLHTAAASGNVELVKEFITVKGYLPDSRDVYGNTLLYYAAFYGHCEMIKVLIQEFSCNVNIKGQYGNSLVHAACESGHLDCVRMLVEDFGCDPMERNEHSDIPVHIAAQFGHESIVKLLVGEFDCSACTRGQYGRTPLHAACQGGHINVVRLLVLEMQCEQSAKDEDGNAPIHIAAAYGQEHVIKLLIEEFGCNAGEKGQYGRTPLHFACQGGHVNLVRLLIIHYKCDKSEIDELGNTPIHYAALHGHESVVKLLTEELGCNAREKGQYGRTPLHAACQGGHINVVRLLVLEMHCEQSAKDEHGNAPIHIAARNGQEHVVKLLVEEFNCTAGEKGEYGRTPLHLACRGGHGNVVRQLILQMQCAQSAKDEHGDAPIHIAAAYGQENIIKLLVEEFGCNPGEKGQYGRTSLHLACQSGHVNLVRLLIINYKCDKSEIDELGNAPIHFAALHGHESVVKLLTEELGCNAREKGQYGRTPLHAACERGHKNLVRLLILELLCQQSEKDEHGNAPIHIAARNGHEHIVKLLVEGFGCCSEEKGWYGMTPLHLACGGGHWNVVRSLIMDYNVEIMPTDEQNNTAFDIAVLCGHITVVKEFIGCIKINENSFQSKLLGYACTQKNWDLFRLLITEFNCDPTTCVELALDSFGSTPLHMACRKNDLDLVHMLITEFHVDTETFDEFGDTPLVIAVMSDNIGIVKEFVGHVHIGEKSEEARQLLEHACERRNVDLLRILLLSFECNPNLLNESDLTTPLHVACENGDVDLAHTLLSEFNVDTSINDSDDDVTALETAVRIGNVDVIKEFIGHVNIEHHPLAFFAACSGGHLEVVCMLISEFGYDIMAADDEGLTGLHYAVENNCTEVITELVGHVNLCNHQFHTLLHFSMLSSTDVTIKLLLQLGVNPISRNQEGRLPIHVAARHGRINIVSTLVNDFNCDPAVRGPNGITPLHEACYSGNLDLVRFLIRDMKCDSCCQDNDGNTPLHFAARSLNDSTPIIRELTEQNGTLLEGLNNRRQTPLHVAVECWRLEIVKFLSKLGCNLVASDIDGNTPLHLAAKQGELNIVKELVEHYAVPMDCWNNNHQLPIHFALERNYEDVVNVFLLHTDGNTPLHIAVIHDEPERLRLLVEQTGSAHSLNSKKKTPLHIAAGKGNGTIVKMLLSEYSCSPTVTDMHGNTPLHLAALSGRTVVLKELAKQFGSPPDCQNNNQQTPLQLAIAGVHLETGFMLISEFQCNVNTADIDGNTVLHLAMRKRNVDVDLVISLLSEYKAYPNPKNSSGHTPLYYATCTLNRNPRIVSELVKYDCNPAAYDEDYRTLEAISQEKLSDGSLAKVFVIGNKYAGKSTLIEALRNETQQDACFTEKVIPHTAGIIPSVHTSEQYGRVLFYDFAGDPEYYSSHAASLERLLTSSCHIFLLVEDFSEEEEAILQTLGYWLTFISYNSKDDQTKSQVVIVGSHADITESKGEDSEEKVCEVFTEISSEFESYNQYIEMVGYCSLDCRESQSTGTEKLYNLLKNCCFSSGEDEPLSVGAVLLLGVLQRDFKGVIACEVSQICRHIELTEMYLPQGVVTVYSYLRELNAQGVILILGNREGLSKEWVILDVSTFLATVHTNLFSYPSLPRICSRKSLSNLGLISESDLKNILGKFDIQLLKQCLKYLQYCIELDDSEILQIIFGTTAIETDASSILGSESCRILGPSEESENVDDSDLLEKSNSSESTSERESSAHTTNSGSNLLFFPALLKDVQRSSMKWFGKELYLNCKGWYIECSREYDYFPPRFLHVLLLRLAFNFTLPACSTRKKKNVHLCSRRCIMWKSGIHWWMNTDVECVVEVVKQSKGVMVMIKSKREFDADCACTFSELVGKVLEAKQEFCHSLITKDYLIHPDDMSQDYIPSFKDLHLFDMNEVKKALTDNERTVVSADECGERILPLSRLPINRMWSKLRWWPVWCEFNSINL